MKIRYDPVDDILLITLKEKLLAYGEEITPQIIAHYSKDNELVEIEDSMLTRYSLKRRRSMCRNM